MAKEILNTATSKLEENPLNQLEQPNPNGVPTTDPPPKDSIPPIRTAPKLRSFESGQFKGVDLEYEIGSEGRSTGTAEEIRNQSNFATGFYAGLKGLNSGTVAAADFVLTPVFATVGAIAGESSRQWMENSLEKIEEKANTVIPSYGEILTEESSFKDSFLHPSTIGSITGSVFEFGLMGGWIKGGTTLLGNALLRSGMTLNAITSAGTTAGKISNGVIGAMEGAGTALTKGTKVFGINSADFIGGIASNLSEGNVMAEELKFDMEGQYRAILNNPYVPQEEKDKIRTKITEAQNNLVYLNTTLAFASVFSFGKIFGKSNIAKDPTLWRFVKTRITPISGVEMGEEMLQGYFNSLAQYESFQNIEQMAEEDPEFRKSLQIDERIDVNGEALANPVLRITSPEEADLLALDNARSTSDFIMHHMFSKQNLLEGVAGLIGGGPQWMLSGAPYMKEQRQAERANYLSQQGIITDIDRVTRSLAEDDFVNEASLAAFLEELEDIKVNTNENTEELRKAVTSYANANIALRAVQEDRVEFLQDLLDKGEKQARKDLTAGVITSEELDELHHKTQEVRQYLSKYEHLTNKVAKNESVAYALQMEAMNIAQRINKKFVDDPEYVNNTGDTTRAEEIEPSTTTSAPMAVAGVDVTNRKAYTEEVTRAARTLHITTEFEDEEDREFAFSDAIHAAVVDLLAGEVSNPIILNNQRLNRTEEDGKMLSAFLSDQLQDAETTEELRQGFAKLFGVEIGTTTGTTKSRVRDNKTATPEKKEVKAETKSEDVKPTKKKTKVERRAESKKLKAEAKKAAEDKITQKGFTKTKFNPEFLKALSTSTIASYDEIIKKEKKNIQANLDALNSARGQSIARTIERRIAKYPAIIDKVNGSNNITYIKSAVDFFKEELQNSKNLEEAVYIQKNLKIILDRLAVVKGIKKVAPEATTAADEAEKNLRANPPKQYVGENAEDEIDHEGITSTDIVEEDIEDEDDDVPFEHSSIDNSPVSSSGTTISQAINNKAKGDLEVKDNQATITKTVQAFSSDPENKNDFADFKQSFSDLVQEIDMDEVEEGSSRDSYANPISGIRKKTKPTITSLMPKLVELIGKLKEVNQSIGGKEAIFIPTKDTIVTVLKDMGIEITPTSEKAIELMLAAYRLEYPQKGEKLKTEKAAEALTEELEDADGIYKQEMDGSYTLQEEEHTIQSYEESATALGWSTIINAVGKRVRPLLDFELYKEGTKIEYEIREIADLPKDERIIVVTHRDPLTPGRIEYKPITGTQFMEGLELTPEGTMGYQGDASQTVEMMTPIKATADGVELGYLHTGQFLTKRRKHRKDGTAIITQDMVDKALDANKALRTTLYGRKEKGLPLTGNIERRLGNIQKNKNFYKGTAIEQTPGKQWVRTGDQLKHDPHIKYSFITKEGFVKEADTKYEIIVPDYLRRQAGAFVALVPLENSNIRVAVKLAVTQIEREEYASMMRLFTEYMVGSANTATNDEKIVKMAKMVGLKSFGTASPRNLSFLLATYVNTLFEPQEGKEYNSMRIGAKASKDDPDILETSFTLTNKKVVKKTGKDGKPDIKEVAVTKTFRINYKVDKNSFIVNKDKKFFGYKINQIEDPNTQKRVNDITVQEGSSLRPATLQELQFFLNSPVADPSLLPYQNINYNSIIDAKSTVPGNKRRPPKSPARVFETNDISAMTSRNYIREVVGKRTLTNLAKPKVINDGDYVYTTNTILQIQMDGLESKTNKKSEEKKKKEVVVAGTISSASEKAKVRIGTLTKVKNFITNTIESAPIVELKKTKSPFPVSKSGKEAPVLLGVKSRSARTLAKKITELAGANPTNIRLQVLKEFFTIPVQVASIDTLRDDIDAFLETGDLKLLSVISNDLVKGLNTEITTAQNLIDNPTDSGIRYEESVNDESTKSDDELGIGDSFSGLDFLLSKEQLKEKEDKKNAPKKAKQEENVEITKANKEKASKIAPEGDPLHKHALTKVSVENPINDTTDEVPPANPLTEVLPGDTIIPTETKKKKSKIKKATSKEKYDAYTAKEEYDRAKRILQIYTYKTGKTEFYAQEEIAVLESIKNIAINLFLGQKTKYLTGAGIDALVTATQDEFIATVKIARNLMRKHINNLELEEDSLEYKKAQQLIDIYTKIITGRDTKRVTKGYVAEGLARAYNAIGYKKIREVNLNDDTGEDPIETGGSRATGWSKTEKNPLDGITARMKAKLGMTHKYTISSQGLPEIETDILGKGTFADANEVYIQLLEMFNEESSHSFDDKVKIINKLVDIIKKNPSLYLTQYHLVDLQDQLKRKGAFNSYSDSEKMEFSTITTKDKAKRRGLKRSFSSGEARLQTVDYGYNSRYQTLVRSMNLQITNLKNAKDEVFHKISDIISGVPNSGYKSLNTELGGTNDKLLSNLEAYLEGEYDDLFSEEELAKQPLKNLTFLIQRIKVLKGELSNREELENDYDLRKEYEFALQDITERVSPAITSKTADLFALLSIPIDDNTRLQLNKAIDSSEDIEEQTTSGSTGGNLSLISSLHGAVSNLATAGFNTNTGTKKSRKENSKNNKKTVLNRNFLSILKWIADKATTKFLAMTTRQEGKSLPNYLDPIYLNDRFKMLKTSAFKKELSSDVYSSGSAVFRIKEKYKKVGKKGLEWLNMIYDLPSNPGIKSSWLANVKTSDDDYKYAFYQMATYLSSIDFGRPTDDREEFGSTFNTIYDDVLNSDGSVAKTYELQARLGAFGLPTFSDKDRPHTVNSFDFKVWNETEEGLEYSPEYVDYFIDTVVVPELNRIIGATQANLLNIDNYDGTLIYSIPGLNKGRPIKGEDGKTTPGISFHVQTALAELGIDSIASLFTMEVEEANKETYDTLVKTIREEVKLSLTEEFQNTREHLIEVGMLVENGKNVQWNENLRNIKEFNNLIVSDSSFTEAEREQVIDDTYRSIDAVGTLLELGGGLENLESAPDDILDALLSNLEKLNKDLFKKDSKTYTQISSKLADMDISPEQAIRDTLGFFRSSDFEHKALKETAKSIGDREKAIKSVLDTTLFDNDIKDPIIFTIGDKIQKALANRRLGNEISDTTILDGVLMNYTYSNMFSNANSYQLIFQDIAGYYKQAGINAGKNKTSQDYDHIADVRATMGQNGKRMGMFVSPGVFSDNKGKVSKDKGKFLFLMVEDIYLPSIEYGEGNKNGISPIKKVNTTDGILLESANARADFLIQEGTLEKKDRKHAIAYWNSEITEQELKEKVGKSNVNKLAATIDKPRFVGTRMETLPNKKTVTVPLYVKMGATLATQTLTGEGFTSGTDKNNNGDKLLTLINELENSPTLNPEGLSVRLVAKSGVKTGGVLSPINLDSVSIDKGGITFIPKGETNPIPLDSSVVIQADYQGWARQQIVDYKEDKSVNNSGQISAIIMSAIKKGTKMKLRNTGVEEDIKLYWEKITTELIDLGLESVDLLFKPEGKTEEEKSKSINNKMSSDAQKRKELDDIADDYTDRQIARIIREAIKIHEKEDPNLVAPLKMAWLETKEDGNFKYNITLSPYFNFYMSTMRAAVQKLSTKAKRNGYNLPMTSDQTIGLSPEARKKKGIVLLKDVVLGPNYSLLPAIPGKNGKASTPAQILLPFNIKLANGEEINMAEFVEDGYLKTDTLPPEIFEQIAYRIPTQDYSMISYVQVVGFFPEAFKTSVIAPKEFISTMGLDFDIDKLFGYKFNLIRGKDGKIRVINEQDSIDDPSLRKKYLDNEVVRIIQTVLSDNNIIRDYLATPLEGDQVMKGFAAKMDKIINSTKKRKTFSFLSPSYQEYKRNSGADAQSGVGVFALLGRTYGVLRGKGVSIKSGKKGEKGQISLGDWIARQYAEENRSSIFSPTKYAGTILSRIEQAHDRIATNISTAITLNVDNENLGLLRAFGMTAKKYDLFSALLITGAGFRLKTVSAMANMPLFEGKNLSSDVKDKLINWYNGSEDRKSSEVIIRAAGKQQNTDIIKSNNFDLLQTNVVDEKGNITVVQIDELEFIEELLKLNYRARQAFASDDSTMLKDIDILRLLQLHNFLDKVTSAYKQNIKSYVPLVNLDSKGINSNLLEVYKLRDIMTGAKTAAYWEDIETNVFEIANHAKVNTKFTDIIDRFLASGNKNLTAVMDIVTEAGVKINSVYDINEVYLSYIMAKFKPNAKSIVERLNRIVTSTDPDVTLLRLTNPFLSRVYTKGDSVLFNNEGLTIDKDIYMGLEALKDLGNIEGVDMAILHTDLINFAITQPKTILPTSYLQHVAPKYFKFDEVMTPNEAQLSQYWVAANVVYSNAELLTTKRASSVKQERVPGYFWKEYITKGSDEYVIHYIDENLDQHTFAEKDLNGPSSEFIADNAAANLTRLPEDMLEGKPELKKEVMDEKRIFAFTERLFSSSTNTNLKKFLRIIYPAGAELELSTPKSSWNPSRRIMSVSKNRVQSGEAAETFIHEIGHSALLTTLRNWQNGVSIVGKNPDGGVIAEELHKVFTNLSIAKTDVISYVAEQFKKAVEGTLPAEDDQYHDYKYLLDAVIKVAFKPIMESRAVFDATRQGLFGDEWESKSMQDVLKEIFDNEEPLLVMKGLRGDEKMNLLLYNKKVVDLGLQDRDFKVLLDTIRDTFFATDKGEEMFFNAINEVDNPDKTHLYFDLIYGITNTNEFTSQAYKMGTRTNYKKEAVYGYNTMSPRYVPIADMPTGTKTIYARAIELIKKIVVAILGERGGNALYRDVLYSKILVKRHLFIKGKEVAKDNIMWEPLEETQDILNCK